MVAWFAALALAVSSPAPRCIQIIGTNDLHGHLEPDAHQAKASAGAAPLQVEQGGLGGLAGYLDVLRAKHPNQVLLVDGGDLFQGTVASNLSKGAAVIAAYNALGYRAAAMGNHEFDFGPERGEHDILGAIKTRLGEAHFPFLACNLVDRATGKLPAWKNLKASTLVTVNGVKVGIIGAITPDTPTVTIPTNVASLKFLDPAAPVAREAHKLRKEGAQLVVLIAHIGGACHDTKNPDDLSSCEPHSEMFSLLDKLPKGTLDVAIAGHTHNYIAQRVDGVAVSEAGSYSHSFGWVEACVGAKGAVTTTLHRPTDVCLSDWAEGGCGHREQSAGTKPATFLGEKVTADEKVEAAIAPYLAKVKAKQQSKVGVTMAAPVLRRHDAPSPLGKLIAQAIKAAVPDADVGLTNAGGVRADLPSGPLQWGEVFEVLPFDNRIVALKLTGKQLADFLVAPLVAGHGFPQLAGAKLEFYRANPDASKLTLNGAPVDPKKVYVLATNDFLANGGDGTKPVMEGVAADHRGAPGVLVRDAFLDYLKSLPSPVQPPAP